MRWTIRWHYVWSPYSNEVDVRAPSVQVARRRFIYQRLRSQYRDRLELDYEIDSVTPVVDVIEYFELAVREAVNPPRATAALTNLGRRVMEIFKPTNRNGLSFVAPSLKFKYVTRALEVLTLGVMIGTLIGAYLKLGL